MLEALVAHLLHLAPLQGPVGKRLAVGLQDPATIARPYINLHPVGDLRSYTLDGEAAVKSARVQLDIWADTATEALALGHDLSAALSGASVTVAGIRFKGIFLEGGRGMTGARTQGLAPLSGWSFDIRFKWEVA
ncbi:MAG: DUF3168 domain-containing protein [Paracoccaceae bacterium]|nr:DUF3168 domain-containing protein [Paracoccaceae bacterium]